MKPHNPISNANLADQLASRWHLKIDSTLVEDESLFKTQYWASCANMFRDGDIVRLEAINGAYDFEVRVHAKMDSGKRIITVSIFPNLPPRIIAAASASSEMVPTMINGKSVPRVDYTEADGWRVIGFDGNVHSNGHPSQSAATLAMTTYLAKGGIMTVADRPAVDGRTGEERAVRAAPSPDSPTQPDLNISFAKRKEVEAKAKKEAQRAADLKRLEERRAASAAEPAA